MFEARADHVRQVIRPALERGAWVVCDRFTDSTVAYQGGGKGVAQDFITRLANEAHPGLQPDLTLVFDASYAVSSQRLAASGRVLDKFEAEGGGFFDRVRQAYQDLARSNPKRVRLIDGSQPQAKVKEEIEKTLASI